MSRYVIRDLDNFSGDAEVPIIWAEDEYIYSGSKRHMRRRMFSYIKPTETLVIIAIRDDDPDFTHSSSWDGDGDGTDGFNTCVIVDDPSEGIHGRKGILQSADLDDDDRQYNYAHKKENMNDC